MTTDVFCSMAQDRRSRNKPEASLRVSSKDSDLAVGSSKMTSNP
ncbi:hypothetical protein [Virgisporangium aurantiacum]|nr:hypothetical protein [Virgisporangium aurantiacum]